jgi:hypothetical protein
MTLLSPRFFVLPLIALAVIASLPRNADTSAPSRTAVVKTMTCAPSASTACVAAAPSQSVVR